MQTFKDSWIKMSLALFNLKTYFQVNQDETTDFSSTAATMAGHTTTAPETGGGGAETTTTNLLDVVSPPRDGRSSFDVEVENTARIQNVLADELMPIKSTLDLTGDNVIQVSGR